MAVRARGELAVRIFRECAAVQIDCQLDLCFVGISRESCRADSPFCFSSHSRGLGIESCNQPSWAKYIIFGGGRASVHLASMG